MPPIKNQVQIITYPDSLGGDLSALNNILQNHFLDIFPGGVHILPPFPSSADRGFAPLNYFQIKPKFGDWDDIRRIGERFDVLLDLMVNHISRQSPYFQDFLYKGRRSEYADLFITLEKIWPEGGPPPADVSRIFLRRPDNPFIEVEIGEMGERETLWATFGKREWSEQIDLDVNSPKTRALFKEILSHMSAHGVKILRLDAVAYVTKKQGTSCFFLEPEIYDFLSWFRSEAAAVGIEILPEVHAHYSFQFKLAEQGYWTYDFVLPFLILHALLLQKSSTLKDYLRVCPRRQFTMLDCHDGIPVQPDVDDIVEMEEAEQVVNICLERGANISPIFSLQHKRRVDFDAHQINCTYYSALGRNDDAYLVARAIQFFAPGVPQVYYVGLLAGENDQEAVTRTGERRAINRRNYSSQEVAEALEKPVVRRLLELIRFRNTYPAFDGSFEVLVSWEDEVRLSWEKGESRCILFVDLDNKKARIEYRAEEGGWKTYFL
jgi:sucrose 6(F)-phosphate phosphorylase